jgi:uncharacterized protein (TIGR00725 family)
MSRTVQIAVVGAAACDEATSRLARETGAELGLGGATVLCGGRGGVMEAACQGAHLAGGRTVGIILYSGLHEARTQIVVLSAAAVVAIGGGWGTLSEIAFALKYRVPVVLLESWNLRRPDGLNDPLLFEARTPADAARIALHTSRRDTPTD